MSFPVSVRASPLLAPRDAAGGLPLDAAMPQLEIAWDPGRMREIFASTLRPRGGETFDILDCRLSRFRYREATRAIMLYNLRVRDPVSGREHEQWATGIIYPGKRSRRRYERLAAEMEQMSLPSSLPFAPVELIPELNMLVQLFPVDRYLPTLTAMTVGPPPEIEAAMLDTFGPGEWQTERCAVSPMRYRASFGATLRYTVEGCDARSDRREKKCFYVKVYRDSGEPTLHLLRTIWERCATGDSEFSTVKPLMYSNSLRALVLDAAPGQSLDEILEGGNDGRIQDSVRHSARALAALHQSDLAVPGHRSKADMLSRARRASTFIGWACPELCAEVSDIVATLEARLEESPHNPTHLDVKPDHLFLDGDRVTLIDLDSAALGDPVLDPASLVARLEALPYVSSVPEAAASDSARTFVDTYFARVPDEWRHRFGLNYACAALKVALFFVQHQEPEWRRRAAMFVDRAGQRVAGANGSPYL